METIHNITIPVLIFRTLKEYLDGIIFHREVENEIEIKFIKCYIKYIDPKILQILNQNKL